MRLELSRGSSNAAPTAQSPRGRISTPSRVSGGPPGWTLALRRFQSTRWLSSAVKSDEFPCPAVSDSRSRLLDTFSTDGSSQSAMPLDGVRRFISLIGRALSSEAL